MTKREHRAYRKLTPNAVYEITDKLQYDGINEDKIGHFLMALDDGIHELIDGSTESTEPFWTDHKKRRDELRAVKNAAEKLSCVSFETFQELNVIRSTSIAVDFVDADMAYSPESFKQLARLAEKQLTRRPNKKATDPRAMLIGCFFYWLWTDIELTTGSGPNSQFNICLKQVLDSGGVDGDPEYIRKRIVNGEFDPFSGFEGRWLRSVENRMRRS